MQHQDNDITHTLGVIVAILLIIAAVYPTWDRSGELIVAAFLAGGVTKRCLDRSNPACNRASGGTATLGVR